MCVAADMVSEVIVGQGSVRSERGMFLSFEWHTVPSCLSDSQVWVLDRLQWEKSGSMYRMGIFIFKLNRGRKFCPAVFSLE